MLEAVELPASVSDLDTGLTDVDRDTLSHFRSKKLDEETKERLGGFENPNNGERERIGVYQDAFVRK